jgi:hypothetical protein
VDVGHASAYVSIRQHTSAYVRALTEQGPGTAWTLGMRQHTSASVSIRESTYRAGAGNGVDVGHEVGHGEVELVESLLRIEQ